MRRHRHRWELVSSEYNPPPQGLSNMRAETETLMAEVLFGVTVIAQRCTECRWMEVTRSAGKVRPEVGS